MNPFSHFSSVISIHALLAESDRGNKALSGQLFQFQSTLSLRRATMTIRNPDNIPEISIHALLAESDVLHHPRAHHPRHFNPRSPCGERPKHSLFFFLQAAISIHALLAESDRC